MNDTTKDFILDINAFTDATPPTAVDDATTTLLAAYKLVLVVRAIVFATGASVILVGDVAVVITVVNVDLGGDAIARRIAVVVLGDDGGVAIQP